MLEGVLVQRIEIRSSLDQNLGGIGLGIDLVKVCPVVHGLLGTHWRRHQSRRFRVREVSITLSPSACTSQTGWFLFAALLAADLACEAS